MKNLLLFSSLVVLFNSSSLVSGQWRSPPPQPSSPSPQPQLQSNPFTLPQQPQQPQLQPSVASTPPMTAAAFPPQRAMLTATPVNSQPPAATEFPVDVAAASPQINAAAVNPPSAGQENSSPLSQLSRQIGLSQLMETAQKAIRNAASNPPPQQTAEAVNSVNPMSNINNNDVNPAADVMSNTNPNANTMMQSAAQQPLGNSVNVPSNEAAAGPTFQVNQAGAIPTLQPPQQRFTRPIQMPRNGAAMNQQPTMVSQQQQPAQPAIEVAAPVIESAAVPANRQDELVVSYDGLTQPTVLGVSRIPHFEAADSAIRAAYANQRDYSLQLANPEQQGLRENPYPAPQVPPPAAQTSESVATLQQQQQQAMQQLNQMRQLPVQQLPAEAVHTNMEMNHPQDQMQLPAAAVNEGPQQPQAPQLQQQSQQ